MIEAVGEAYWPSYFATIDRLLAPGGKVSIQAITMAHERVLATKQSFSWIQKYISPGGIIPSLQSIDETLATHTTLRVTERRELGAHYARTLHLWHDRFNEQWPRVHQLGFDETFRRMWEFYLAYCEAGFAVGYLGVSQLQMTREPPGFVRTAQERHRRETPGHGLRLPVGLHHDHAMRPRHGQNRPDLRRRGLRNRVSEHLGLRRPRRWAGTPR